MGHDPEQPPPAGPRLFGLDGPDRPVLAGWAVRVRDIQTRVARARASGYDPGPVHGMTRTLPDGTPLHWKLTLRAVDVIPSLIPFLIDWGDTPHPSAAAAQGAELLEFRGETPRVAETRKILAALEVELEVCLGSHPLLAARIQGPKGEITL